MFRRLILFFLLIQFGAASEVIVNVVECLARAYRHDRLTELHFRDTPLIIASIIYVIGGLVYTTLFQEKLLSAFAKNRIPIVIAVLILGAVEMGYFFEPICAGEKTQGTSIKWQLVPPPHHAYNR